MDFLLYIGQEDLYGTIRHINSSTSNLGGYVFARVGLSDC